MTNIIRSDKPLSNDHGNLAPASLLDDDHAQYPLQAGRSGGQTLAGGTVSGNNLTLSSTTHATKGRINLGSFAFANEDDSPGYIIEGLMYSYPGILVGGIGVEATGTVVAFPGVIVDAYGDTGSPYSLFRRSRGGKSSIAATQTGDELGTFGFRGAETGAFLTQDGARFGAFAAENHTGTSQATDLIFYTAPSGSIVPTERFRLWNDGRISGKSLHNNAGAITGTTDQFFASGTYTPTLANVANIAASTAYQCQYTRTGNVVMVSGKVDVDATLAATSTQLGISLPIASNLGAAEDCAGTGHSPAVATQGAAILGDATNNRAQMQFISADLNNQAMYFMFQYEIL